MNIEELEDKHGDIPLESLNFDEFHYKKHAKTSVEYAISVLEEVNDFHYWQNKNAPTIKDKIQELKQYLNE